MLLRRIARRAFADLTGDGARRLGGRWNSPGRAVVYLADSVALAILEVRVHLDIGRDFVPRDYVLVDVEVSDALAIEDMTSLAAGTDPRVFGDAWLAASSVGERPGLLRVPSFVAPDSFNLLANPAAPGVGAALSIRRLRPFSFDERLWPA